MTILLKIFSLFLLNFILINSQSCFFVSNGRSIDLSEFIGHTFSAAYLSDGVSYSIYYSPCRDGVYCDKDDDNHMTLQEQSDSCVTYLADWNSSIIPSYSSSNGGSFTFSYNNGQSSGCSGPRQFSVTYQCDANAYPWGEVVVSETKSCVYTMTIATAYACAEVPSCIYNVSNHVLSLLPLAGTILEAQIESSDYIISYKPCHDLLYCPKYRDKYMALQWSIGGTCGQYLAKWDNGTAFPTYSSDGGGSYTFFYTNGAPIGCDSNRVFSPVFQCNKTANPYGVITATEPELCQYKMVIPTVYACT